MADIGDRADYLRRLEAKLAPDRIRATLAFAGLYQMTHEFIKRSVLDGTRGFFGWTQFNDTWLFGEDEYKAAVLSKVPRNPFKSSLQWLVEMGAITEVQADRLEVIYAHRHELTHELAKFVVDLDFEPDLDLFVDALGILRDLSRFWTRIEIDIGSFEEHGDIDVDDVHPMNLVLLDLCISAYREGLHRDGSQE